MALECRPRLSLRLRNHKPSPVEVTPQVDPPYRAVPDEGQGVHQRHVVEPILGLKVARPFLKVQPKGVDGVERQYRPGGHVTVGDEARPPPAGTDD